MLFVSEEKGIKGVKQKNPKTAPPRSRESCLISMILTLPTLYYA